MYSQSSRHSLSVIPCGCGGRPCTFRIITLSISSAVACVCCSPQNITRAIPANAFVCLVAGVVFYVAKAKFLPRLQSDKMFRWDYDYVEVGDVPLADSYALTELDANCHPDSDEWTVGSSSSVSSGSVSPVDESQSLWEGETLASHSDSEAQH